MLVFFSAVLLLLTVNLLTRQRDADFFGMIPALPIEE
jgi:hypothetical protein